MFPEGGLTRDGRLRPPKLGLLSYMVSAFDPKGPRDAVFVPVGINYDRVIEDRVQVAAADDAGGREAALQVQPEGAVRLSRRTMWRCACAASSIATAMPASASASRCRCANT